MSLSAAAAAAEDRCARRDMRIRTAHASTIILQYSKRKKHVMRNEYVWPAEEIK